MEPQKGGGDPYLESNSIRRRGRSRKRCRRRRRKVFSKCVSLSPLLRETSRHEHEHLDIADSGTDKKETSIVLQEKIAKSAFFSNSSAL